MKWTKAQRECYLAAEPTMFGEVRLQRQHGRSVAAFRRRGWAEGFYLTEAGKLALSKLHTEENA